MYIFKRFNKSQKFSSFIGEFCPAVEVTGANRPSFNGCYTKDENILAYNGPADQWIIFKRQDGVGYWRIGYKDISNDVSGRLFYTKTSSYGGPQPGPQGEYESSDDESIATVNCKSECIDDKKLSNAKSMKKKGKLDFNISIN